MPRTYVPCSNPWNPETKDTIRRDNYTLSVYYALQFDVGMRANTVCRREMLEYLASGGLAERRDDGLWYRTDDPYDRREDDGPKIVRIVGGPGMGRRKMKSTRDR